jgi:hypothetical protein
MASTAFDAAFFTPAAAEATALFPLAEVDIL